MAPENPVDGEFMEDHIQALGTTLRAQIIGLLRERGAMGRGDIAAALNAGVPVVAKSLIALMAAGALIADPPLADRKRGQRVVYTVNDAVVTEMWVQLGRTIGEI